MNTLRSTLTISVALASLAWVGDDDAAWIDGLTRLPRQHLADTSHVDLQGGSVVYDIAISPDGTSLATVGGGGVIDLWDLESLDRHHEVELEEQHAFSVAFSEDGEWVVAGGRNGTVYVLQTAVRASVPHKTLRVSEEDTKFVAFGRSVQEVLAVTGSGQVGIWSVETGRRLEEIANLERDVSCAELAHGGTHVLLGCADGRLYEVELQEDAEPVLIGRVEGNVLAVSAPSPSDACLVIGNREAALWSATRRNAEGVTLRHRGLSIAWLPDVPTGGRVAVYGGLEGDLVFIDAESGDEVSRLPTGAKWLSAIAFESDAGVLAAASGGGRLTLLRRGGS